MSIDKDNSKINQNEGGFDYESAYSAAENATLDPKKARESRAAVIEERIEEHESPRQTRARLRRDEERSRKRRRIIAVAALLAGAAIIAAATVMYISYREKQAAKEAAERKPVEVSAGMVHVEEIYTFGTHLNISGTLPKEALNQPGTVQTELVLFSEEEGEFTPVPIIIDGSSFKLAEKYNGGLYLDHIARNTYKMFIRVTLEEVRQTAESETTTEESEPESVEETSGEESSSGQIGIEKKKPDEPEEEETESESAEPGNGPAIRHEIPVYYQYYALVNDTDYQETVYITMSSAENSVAIGNESEYQTMQMTVSSSAESSAFDIVIDPGHGGSDQGAAGVDGHHEKEYLLPLALKIKDNLEKAGMKVALTRDNDSETLGAYGEDGRVARAAGSQAKYMISLHMNDEGYGQSGLMIYSYPGIDYAFARLLNENIQTACGIGNASAASAVGDNIFTKMLSQEDIDQEKADNIAAGLTPYEPTLRSAYHFMIRECGGIVTGAFKDDRNPEEKGNPYCYDNTCPEPYIIELGYITDQNDLNIMMTKMDDYARAISDSLLAVYRSELLESEE